MIDVQDLTKDYGSRRAISGISFKVERGEVLGFLGPNGAGKTTTMRIITGFMPPTSGTVTIAGFDIFRQSMEARRHVGYLPESVPLYTEMSVRGYLDFMAKIKGVPRARRSEQIDRAMEATRVQDRAKQLIGKLSKGYRQRVGLSQALLGDPDVLILDEPTVGLDPRQITEVRDLIKEIGRDHAVILSTHILPEVSMVCSRVLIVDDGKEVAVDTPENLVRQLRGSEAVQVSVRGPRAGVMDAIRAVPHVLSVSLAGDEVSDGVASYTVATDPGADVREALAKALVDGGYGLLELRMAGVSLEDVFLRLTTEESDEDDEAGEEAA
ncbi:MAG TPA: ATP-binding cassette domain-containing protein [Chloroflexota bacterium]|nr:ATP-binding cassette domain-containing protein [Chloroflexota bacterium]